MKKIIYGCIVLVLCAFILTGCGVNTKTIKRMQSLEEGVSSPTTIEELETAIKKYQERVEDIVLADQQTGIWYKMLGSRYLDNKMYGKALEAFQKATEYYPANPNLYFYVAICAGNMAKQSLDYTAIGSTAQKYNYFKLAEDAYLRALELDPRYARALYGIGILYAYELDEPLKAIPYLQRLLEIEKLNTDGMFALARAYYTTYDFDNAIAMYDRIIATTQSPEKKLQAEENKKTVLEALHAR